MLSGGDAGHPGFGGTARASLHRGGTRPAQVDSRAGRAHTPATGPYELVAAGQHGTTAWSPSTTTSTGAVPVRCSGGRTASARSSQPGGGSAVSARYTASSSAVSPRS